MQMQIFLSELFSIDKPLLSKHGDNTCRICLSPLALTLLMILATLSCSSIQANADIYRFVTVDGVETFTDTPVNKEARLVAKENIRKNKKGAKKDQSHSISLDEIAAKTVQSSLNQQDNHNDTASFEPRLPPVGGIITSSVGMRIDPIDKKLRHHNGIDIAISEGTPVTPAEAGSVIYSGHRSGYGNTVLIEHSNGLVTLYGHNSRLLVSPGQLVEKDTVIALSGNTGRSTGPHLHFEAWQGGVNVTPAFMTGNVKQIPRLKLASGKAKTHFRKEILTDGSILFTNIPSSIP